MAVARVEVWDAVDERAHFSYIENIARKLVPPVLGYDCSTAASLNVDSGSRIAPPQPPCTNLGTSSYEAFQPPLYYYLAAPLFALPLSTRGHIYAIRTFDLILLLITVVLILAISRRVAPRRPLATASIGLLPLLWPGVILRAVTISNAALELPLTLGFVYAAWRADQRDSRRWLMAAGALLGACLLTKLTLIYLAAIFAVAVLRYLLQAPARRWRAALAAAIVPLIVLSPWLALNVHRYGTLTANGQAQVQQTPVINPRHVHYTVANLPSMNGQLFNVLPQEWRTYSNGPSDTSPHVNPLVEGTTGIGVLIWACFVLFWLARGPRQREAYFGWPIIGAVVTLNAVLLLQNWPLFIPRYIYPALVPLGLYAALMLWQSPRATRRAGLLSAVVTIWFAAIWAYLAHKYLLHGGVRANQSCPPAGRCLGYGVLSPLIRVRERFHAMDRRG
jgi:4-amino-4-deoxy-L-arabinose transferase-like glycosyltransferase